MTRTQTPARIRVGARDVPLPEGVSLADWALERNHAQNPRIRTFLGCIRTLEEVMDSNFAILHCSPERLGKIRRHLGRTADVIRRDLDPLLRLPSKVPELEKALRVAETALDGFERTVLPEIDHIRNMPLTTAHAELRESLCVLAGKVHYFLVETFGRIMAADPRSHHDSDYFLSRRFPRDIEEAEWLYATVDRLQRFLDSLGYERSRSLQTFALDLRREQTLLCGRAWEQVRTLLELLVHELTPKLKEILVLRGIRYAEVEMLDRHSSQIPGRCRMVLELYESGNTMAGEIVHEHGKSARDVASLSREVQVSLAILGRRIAELLERLDRSLLDLTMFVPLWLNNISMRRALLLRKIPPAYE